MNKYIKLLVGNVLMCSLLACSNKQPTEKVDETRIVTGVAIEQNGVHKMQAFKIEETIDFKEKKYQFSITRTPNDSLPKVKDEVGDVFLDNEITLRITEGSRTVIDKTFTKQSFASVVPADFLKKSILEGMVFDKKTATGLVYAVSVSYPQTDLYIPVSLTITPDGKISMVKAEQMEEIWEE